MSFVLSFEILMSTLRSATPEQQWTFKTFVDGIVRPAPAPAPALAVSEVPAPVVKAKEKEKKPRKATKAEESAPVIPTSEEEKLLAPVDGPSAGAGATAPIAAVETPSYRLAVVNSSLCMARKIDKKAPIPGTRPEDPGSNGKFYPELQCSKKPVAGSKLCKICAEKHAEAMKSENANKAIESYYGLLDETELYWNSQVVGSEKFKKKYPKGLPVLSNTVVTNTVAQLAPPEPEPESVAAISATIPAVVTEKPITGAKKSVRKATKAAEKKDEDSQEHVEPSTRKVCPAPVPESTVEEWELFLFEGTQYIRHKTTHNCYLVNGEEHELVRMVRRDAYEGKWRDGTLDRYAQEDDA